MSLFSPRQTPAPQPAVNTPSSPKSANAHPLDALTGGVFSAATASERATRVRDWLARAVRAPRDPQWVADGFTAASWAPISPVTGRLDAFEWRVPPSIGEPSLPAIDLRIVTAPRLAGMIEQDDEDGQDVHEPQAAMKGPRDFGGPSAIPGPSVPVT